MPATLTIPYSINNMENFLADLYSASNCYYYWIGKTTPWPVDANPPQANQSYAEMFTAYHDMVYGKLISNTQNIYPLANTVAWTSNTVYSQYDTNDDDFFSENFCIYTTTGGLFNVYKCIDNAGGIPSTAMPQLKPISGCFSTSDGYTWKYMYTTTTNAFNINNYLAIVPNTSIEAAAVPGTIDAYRLQFKGTDYQGYNEGTIRNVISSDQIQLANTAVNVDNFYTGCTLYLKSGLGAGQISNIVSYIGTSQIATVNPSFAIYIDMQVTNITGMVSNDQLVQQISESIAYLNTNGYFNIGDTLVQSDTGYSGNIISVNSAIVVLTGLSNLNAVNVGGTIGFPMYDTDSVTVITGNVSINASSNVITSNSANVSYANLRNLSVGQYIQVGNVSSASNATNWSNVRRVTSITNANTANVDLPFISTLTAAKIYTYQNAMEPVSATILKSQGVIVDTNLSGLTLNYGNTSPNNASFVLGETVKEFSNTGADLGANGIVSFVNSSTLILSGVSGTFTVGNDVVGYGLTSNVTAIITNISAYPQITVGDVIGNFQSGLPIYTYNLGNNVIVGTATTVSFLYIPSDNVEYVVSPTVTINGDGEGAAAYAVVNVAPGTVFEIEKIVPINVGNNYTEATVTITAANNYGVGAAASAVVAPPSGHGGDPIGELGSRNVGISFAFSNAAGEIYKFPNYGTYRRAGIIKNPVFADLFVQISPTNRNNLTLTSLSAAFTNNEIIFQPATNAAARFISGNSSIMQIDNISGTLSNTGNTTIIGLISNSTATIGIINTLSFSVRSNQPIYDKNGSSANLTEVVNSSVIRLTNVGGKFGGIGDVIYDPTVNSYANVVALYTANDTLNQSGVYGLRFNQTSRITISSNTGPYQVGERIYQNIEGANGLVIDTSHELDIVYTVGTGTFSTGIVLTDNTSSGNAIITFVNTTYMRLTGVQGTFTQGDSISCITGNGIIDTVYPVLVVGDVLETYFVNGPDTIVGANSGAIGVSLVNNTIVNPDLVRDTGTFLYINDFSPFSANLNSSQQFISIIGF